MSLTGRRLLSVALLAVAMATSADTPGFAFPTDFRFRRLTAGDGLSQGVVNDILQDRSGFVWIATQDGLNRFDGQSFLVYQNDPEDPGTIGDNSVSALAEDDAGRIWYGTEGAGFGYFDPLAETFHNFRFDPGAGHSLEVYDVLSLAAAPGGDIWVGTARHGLLRFDVSDSSLASWRHRESDTTTLTHDEVWSLAVDAAGQVWAGTSGGLNRVDPATGTVTRFVHDPESPGSLMSNLVYRIVPDSSGRLWVGTVDGLDALDPDTGRFRHYRHDPGDPNSLSSHTVGGIAEDSAGRLWIATMTSGLNLLDPETGRCRRLRHDPLIPNTLSSDLLNCLTVDQAGLLWVGSSSGINLLNPESKRFVHMRAGDPAAGHLSDRTVWSVEEDSRGNVWIGTEDGLNRMRHGQPATRVYRPDAADPSSICNSPYSVVYEDSHGTVWVGSDQGGLCRYLRGSDAFFRYRAGPGATNGLRSDRIFGASEDAAGILWFATLAGLHSYDRATDRFVCHAAGGAGSTDAAQRAVLADSRGRVWTGSWNEEIQRFDPRTGELRTFRHDPDDPRSPSGNVVICFAEDRRRRVWIGTSNGLNRYVEDSDDFERFGVRDGLPNAMINGILEDDRDRLWISSNQGLSCYSPDMGVFVNYDLHDGLQANEFNSQSCRLGPGGRMYFGGINGVTVFRPEQIRSSRNAPRVVITDLQVDNLALGLGPGGRLERPVHMGGTVRLGPDDHVVTFAFAALDFASPGGGRYAYRLEGFDDTWQQVLDRHHATYTNLPPGRFEFRVRGTNHDGLWSPHEGRLTVEVAPPIWKTLWFQAAAAMALAGLVLGLHRFRTRLIRRRNRDLEHAVRLRTSDLESEIAVRRRTEKELRQAEEEAVAATRSKSAFLANMSHEIRTPLNGVIGLTTALLDTDLDEDQRDYCQMARSSANALLKVINDVLDFSKIEAGKLELELVEFSPRDVVDEVGDMLTMPARDKGLQCLSMVAAHVPTTLVGDPGRLRQILLNLAGNAVKFTTSGRVEMRISATTAGGRTRLRGEVRDTGVGLPDGMQDGLFGSFTQADASTTRRFGGTGLGLAISRQLVNLMDGTIGCANRTGGGALFWFEIPLAAVPVSTAAKPCRGQALVVVEDQGQREALEALLIHGGYGCTAVADSTAAGAALAAGDHYDVLLAETPSGRVGLDDLAFRAINPPGEGPTKLVFVDAPAEPAARAAARGHGFTAWVSVPFNHRRVLDALAGRDDAPNTAVETDPDGLRLLLAEDNPINQRVAGLILDKLGYAYDVVASGEEAVRLLGERPYGAVLMDIQMPGMDGLEATRLIRNPATPVLDHDIPIIAMTAHALAGDRARSLAAGMDDHVTKPVDSATLAATLDRYLTVTA